MSARRHPADHEGKRLIRRILELQEVLKVGITVAFLQNYEPPLEALGRAG